LGENYRHMLKYDSALYYYQLAEDISVKISFFTYNSYLFANRGLAYAAMGEKALADSLLTRAIQLFITEKDLKALTQTYHEMAKIAYRNNDFSGAFRLATQAFETADTNHFILELKDISQLLSRISEEQQNFTDAYRYLKSYNQFSEKVSGDSILSKISEMRAEFEISQKEQEVIYFKKISRARTIVAIVTGIAGLLVVLLALFLYKLTQRLRSANQLLGEYNEELNQKNHIIHQALLDKEVLIKEIHHRVKNNLQIISSIINLQSMRIRDKATQEIFEEMQRRILAISSIHQKLYQSDSVTSINMKDYLSEVVDSIHIAFNNPQLNVKYEIMIQQIVMDIDSAVSMGLMVNELATNAYKYAFKPEQNNQFLVKLENPEPEKYQLTVKDNGLGLPTDFSLTKANSLGLRMVSLLTRQLKGDIRFYNQDGAVFEVVF
ncbi:MAG: sensor histidine kinase, partial [Salinivirgaceae bacterium]|nr:sensor histidine kinase [Salinivirgaceae bacterium]